MLVGYGLYFFTYSTFQGRSLYLEDLYVSTTHRGQGIGTAMWKKVAQVSNLKSLTTLMGSIVSDCVHWELKCYTCMKMDHV